MALSCAYRNQSTFGGLAPKMLLVLPAAEGEKSKPTKTGGTQDGQEDAEQGQEAQGNQDSEDQHRSEGLIDDRLSFPGCNRSFTQRAASSAALAFFSPP